VVAEAVAPPRSFVAVTFNTGTTQWVPDKDVVPGTETFTRAHARTADDHYGNGLAWLPAVHAVTAFFAAVDPDVVVFQEIFWPGWCPEIPAAEHKDFICQDWQEGDPTVAEQVLGPDYQVCCQLNLPDKCAAVHRRFGRFRGCDAAFCLNGLDGALIEGCGRGGRIGRGTIDLVAGGTLTLVNIHATSGIRTRDQECRVAQFDQVFVDLGDGQPGANGVVNLIMGDLNTDPRGSPASIQARIGSTSSWGRARPFAS
jgi:hypothetical protein